MTTEMVITGTGTAMPSPGRAGPGALIRRDGPHGVVLQIDAGRGTTMRLTDAGISLPQLDALFLTHHHSDHMLGLPDLLLTRWLQSIGEPSKPLPVYCPDGPAAEYAGAVFDHLMADIANRKTISDLPEEPEVDLHPFIPDGQIREVIRFGDLIVETTLVDHGELLPAVGYRFSSVDGVVVVSGDTTTCDPIRNLAQGADILVHEVFQPEALLEAGTSAKRVENLGRYHADAVSLGALAAAAGVKMLILTHLIPPPATPEQEQTLIDQIRDGGFAGELLVARDLDFVALGAPPPE